MWSVNFLFSNFLLFFLHRNMHYTFYCYCFVFFYFVISMLLLFDVVFKIPIIISCVTLKGCGRNIHSLEITQQLSKTMLARSVPWKCIYGAKNTKRWTETEAKASKQAPTTAEQLFSLLFFVNFVFNTWGVRIPWLCVPNYSGHLPRYPVTLWNFRSPLVETITLSTTLDCWATPPRPSTSVFHL